MDIDRYQSQPRKQMCSIKEKASITDFNIKSMLASQLRKSLLEANHLNSLHFEKYSMYRDNMSFSGGSDSKKKSACNVGAWGSIPSSGRPPREGNGNLLQYSAWEIRAIEKLGRLGVPKSWTRLSDIRFHCHFFIGIIKHNTVSSLRRKYTEVTLADGHPDKAEIERAPAHTWGRGCHRRVLCSAPESLSLESAALPLSLTEVPQDRQDCVSFVQRVLQPGLNVHSRQVTCTEPPKRRKFPKGCLGKVHFHSINMYHLSWEADQSGQSPTTKNDDRGIRRHHTYQHEGRGALVLCPPVLPNTPKRQ